MKPLILCRERFDYIERVLERFGGKATIRDLKRSFQIHAWEIEQSAALGWLTITTRKPPVGRPSRVVEFRDYETAKLPEERWTIESVIRPRHCLFAKRSVEEAVLGGIDFLGITLPGIVSAYISVYHPKSRNGAYASTSRLLRRNDVRAARQWFYAQANFELPYGETMPETASGIWTRLRELGSWRARLGGFR